MIPSGERLFCPYGIRNLEPPISQEYSFVDYDTRRWVKFLGPDEPFGQDDGELATEVMTPIFDQLEVGVTMVTFQADGKHWVATKHREDDVTPVTSYPKFTKDEVGSIAEITLRRGKWEEVDRLAPRIDLIRTRPAGAGPGSLRELFVFKYYIIPDPQREQREWTSAFYHRALSVHPNIVPFGDFVIHEEVPVLVGYTTKYIPGGNLYTRHLPLFKRAWIQQLTELIDLLNLKYGLLHQDIAARNLFLDEKQDKMLLFDFEHAAFHGSASVMQIADDVGELCFTVYELLTGDYETGSDRWTRNLDSIMKPEKSWTLKENMQLEPGVSTDMIKHEMKEWARKRHENAMPSTFELQKEIFCPEMKIDRVLEAVKPEWGIHYPAHHIINADPEGYIIRWEREASAHRRHS